MTPGPIPSWIGNLTKLQDVSLRETGRFSDIPTEFGLLKNLTLLDLHNNGLTGPLPRQLGELPNLRFLILSRNQLTSTVPADFELLTSLGMLFAYVMYDLQALTMIPILTLYSWQHTEMLMLNDNSFTGSVDGICSKGIVPSVFAADCKGEVTCSCCTTCCVDTDDACNEMAEHCHLWIPFGKTRLNENSTSLVPNSFLMAVCNKKRNQKCSKHC